MERFNFKKTLIIVPHQDDEINIAGGIIYSMKNKNDIIVAFVTNGDYIYAAKDRYNEAIKSLKILGVCKKNIIFMGYSDQPYDASTHMYNSDDNWISKRGFNKTYGTKEINEWNFSQYGVHCLFNKENVIRNIKEIILKYMPETIICVDLDFHPDHIMTSLCFESAMGQILKLKLNYHPNILKTFAYENSYLGNNDFFIGQENISKFLLDNKQNLRNNSYYNINDCIRIPILHDCFSYNLLTNPVWKAIKCHKSQLLISHATRMINRDYVYWQRNTNNLLNNSLISVSSSNSSYLNDFLLCDSTNILNGNIKKIIYDKGIWIPQKNDEKKTIDIIFDSNAYVKYLKIYNGQINKKYIKKIKIIIDNKEQVVIDLKQQLINNISLECQIKHLKIIVMDEICFNGFSEIEVIGNEKNELYLIDKMKKDYDNKNEKHFIFVDKIIMKIDIFLYRVYRKIFIKKHY